MPPSSIETERAWPGRAPIASTSPEQGFAQAGHLVPVLVDHREQDLSAGLTGLAALAHRIDDREAPRTG